MKKHEFGFEEAKLSGGSVYAEGVKASKQAKAIRRIAEPLMKKHWQDKVINLHRIYRVAEYIYKRQRRNK
jgi:ribosomal protein L18E